MRLLFIGNSYTNRNDLPGLLARIAAAATPPLVITSERVIRNGASLRHHWNADEAVRLIREGEWDVVVLQEQSTLPLKNRTRYHENVRLFAGVLKERGIRTVLFLNWPRVSALDRQGELTEAVSSIAAAIGADVAPVGPAWERVRLSGEGPELYEADGSHPTPAGSYLAACVFYAALTGRSPEGVPLPDGIPLPAAEADLLQRAAWAAVRDRPPAS